MVNKIITVTLLVILSVTFLKADEMITNFNSIDTNIGNDLFDSGIEDSGKTNSNLTNYKIPEKGKHYNEVRDSLKKRERRRLREKNIKESPLRRFEITFFISFAILFNLNYAVMSIWSGIESNFNTGTLNPIKWTFVFSNTIVLSTYIACYDVYKTFHKDRKNRKRKTKKQISFDIPIIKVKF